MTENRKNAYRWLLYGAMLSIRTSHGFDWKYLLPWNLPKVFRYNKYAGLVAQALHNLALYAASDFQDFDEAHFWNEVLKLEKQGFPKCAQSIHDEFELRLSQLNNADKERPPRVGCPLALD